jgi:TPR repeat protein
MRGLASNCWYENGWGLPASAQEAGLWFGKAADQGHDDAVQNLNKSGRVDLLSGPGKRDCIPGWLPRNFL